MIVHLSVWMLFNVKLENCKSCCCGWKGFIFFEIGDAEEKGQVSQRAGWLLQFPLQTNRVSLPTASEGTQCRVKRRPGAHMGHVAVAIRDVGPRRRHQTRRQWPTVSQLGQGGERAATEPETAGREPGCDGQFLGEAARLFHVAGVGRLRLHWHFARSLF